MREARSLLGTAGGMSWMTGREQKMWQSFSLQIVVMLSFMDLDKDTKFESYFLSGLFSENHHKAKAVFDRIGEVIYDFWNSSTCVSEQFAPEAYTIVQANEFVTNGYF